MENPLSTNDRRARAHELVDLLLGDTTGETPASAEAIDYSAMTDEELLRSDVGTRVRKILFDRLAQQAEEFYADARLKGSAATMLGGINLARDWVYPEDVWEYGFREAAQWDVPYHATDADREELMRRIAARNYKVTREQVERMAMDIAEEREQASA
jgi:hypothetical protein